MYTEESILLEIMEEECKRNKAYLKNHPQTKDGKLYIQMNDIYNDILDGLYTLSRRVNLKFYEYRYNVEGVWHVDFSFYSDDGRSTSFSYLVRDLVDSPDIRILILNIINKAMGAVKDVKGC